MNDRQPDELLTELGVKLDSAFTRAAQGTKTQKKHVKWRKVAFSVSATAIFLTSSAAATRSFWAPSPPDAGTAIVDKNRRPSVVHRPIYIASSKNWRLSFSSCRYDHAVKIGLFLSLQNGTGGGIRCDLGQASGINLNDHTLQRYYDPVRNQTWFFSTVPQSTKQIFVTTTTAEKDTKTFSVKPQQLDSEVKKFPFLRETAAIIFTTNGFSSVQNQKLITADQSES